MARIAEEEAKQSPASPLLSQDEFTSGSHDVQNSRALQEHWESNSFRTNVFWNKAAKNPALKSHKDPRQLKLNHAPDTTLERTIVRAGALFSLDQTQWKLGMEKTWPSVVEDGFKVTKITRTFKGVKLHLQRINTYSDSRVPEQLRQSSFVAIETEDHFRRVLDECPYTEEWTRGQTFNLIAAKFDSGDPDLAAEAMHGLWEMSVERKHHAFFTKGLLSRITAALSHGNILAGVERQACVYAAATVWSLGVTASLRAQLVELEVVPPLVELIRLTNAYGKKETETSKKGSKSFVTEYRMTPSPDGKRHSDANEEAASP
eukprot:gene8182-9715_t